MKKTKKAMPHTAVRLSDAVIARLDKFARRLSVDGKTVSRSEAIRIAMVRGMDEMEKKQ